MKSIKPGRGPSGMNAIGAAAAAVFGVIWLIAVLTLGAPIFFALFGVVFIVIALMQAVYHFRNATGKNRYSKYDIAEDSEEPDPLNERFGEKSEGWGASDPAQSAAYCPYCGEGVAPGYAYCPKCGKELPKS